MTAKYLIAIAQDQRIGQHIDLMPPAWSTLYEITWLTRAPSNNDDDPHNAHGVPGGPQNARGVRDDLQSAHDVPHGARSPRRDDGDSRTDRDRGRSSRRGRSTVQLFR